DALGVVQLAPGVGDARARVGSHPAAAHLVRAEEPLPAGPQRLATGAGDERLEVVAAPPARRAGRDRADGLRARGLVHADARLEGVAQVALVRGVGHRVVEQRLAVVIERDAAVPARLRAAHGDHRVAQLGDELLVLAADE